MRVVAFLSIVLALLVGCETQADRYQRERAEVRRQIEAIPVGQRVTQTNADILASAYWRRYCSICGMVGSARDQGQYWAAPVVAGIIPVPAPDILVEKTTGNISWNKGPTITNWSELCK